MPLNLPNIGPNNNFAGVGEFTRALMGGGATREQAFRDELGALASAQKKVADSAMAARQNTAQANLSAQDFIDMGVAEQMAEAARRSYLASGGNFNALTGGANNLFEQSLRRRALDAAEQSGKFAPYNVPLVGLANKPLETANIEGGNIMLDQYSDAPAIMPTEETNAQIESLKALVNQRNASAGASMAREALSARTDPNRPRGGGRKPVAAAPSGPKVGDVEDGYRFKGGNPSDPAAWEKL